MLHGLCTRDSLAGCFALGLIKHAGVKGVAKDVAGANELLARVCLANLGQGCFVLGLSFDQGAGVPEDPKRGAQLFEDGCAKGSDDACLSLGIDYYKGRGVTKDLGRARIYFERACKGKVDGACDLVSTMDATMKATNKAPRK